MNRLRDIMRDRRVAGALAVVALLLVGYRFLPLREKGRPSNDPPPGRSGRVRKESLPEGRSRLLR